MHVTEKYLLAAILTLATALRLWGINHEIYTDENKVLSPSVRMAQGQQEPRLYPHGSHYPHFYQNILAISFVPPALLGIPYPNSTPALDIYTLISRVISAAFGIATVFMTYVVGKQLGSPRLGLLSSLFIAVIPLHVKYSHYTHVELPLGFFTMLCVWAALHILPDPKPRWYIFTGALVGLCAATNYTGIVTGVVLLVVHGLYLAQQKRYSLKAIFSKPFILGLVAIPILFALATPYTLIKWEKSLEIYHNLSKRGAAGDIGHTRPDIFWPLYNDSKDWGLPFTGASLTQEFGTLLLVTALFGLAVAIYRRNYVVSAMVGLTTVVMYIAIIGQLPLYAVKRLLPLAPFVAILAAYGIDWLLQQERKWKTPASLLAFITTAAIVIPSIKDDAGFSAAFAGGSTHSTAVSWAASNLPTESAVLQHTPIRLLNWDDPRFKTIRLDEVYSSLNKDDPEVSHDRAKPIEWWIEEKSVDFVAMDSRIVDRYYDATSVKLFPETTASYQAFYNDIRARGKLVFKIEAETFKIAGPRVEIYDVREVNN